MKLVICLMAGFVLSLTSLTTKNQRPHAEKSTQLVRIHHH